jgi:serine/threonine protein kinase
MGMRMLENGTILQDRFLIDERIGVGGMGAVYLATDQKFGSRVAVKQTFYDNAELAEAFEREARLLNTLHHPVLPHVSDFFSEGGEMLLVMEYIDGEDLSEVLKRGERPAIDDVVSWTRELLDALDYLHSQEPPIIHRDIKPNNLKRTPRGNIVLLDFGLAKETSGNKLGMRSVFGYSRRYSPLEQIEGAGTDVRSDIFSLGATIFHLLTGEPPIDVLARVSAVVAGRPDPLKLASEMNPEVPPGFAAVSRSALELNPDHRFISAAAMRSATEHAVGTDQTPADAEELTAEEPSVDTISNAPSFLLLSDQPVDSDQPGIPPPAAVSPPVVNRYRVRKKMFWLRPALAAAILLVLSGIAFTVYNSGRSNSYGTAVEANISEVQPPSAHGPAGAAGEVNIPNADQGSAGNEKPRKDAVAQTSRREKAAKRPASTRTVSGDRSRKAAVQPRQPVSRPRRNEPRVVTIETIFTGRPARDN